MDVHCATCGEPYDTYHMRHDAIWETDLDQAAIKAFTGTLTKEVKEAFRRAGYVLAGSVYAIVRCPSCPKDKPTDREGAEKRAVISELLAGDEDGIAATLEDFGL
jgi:hypothetical protein